MKKRLDRKFFNRDTLTVAKDLLGKYLVRKIGNKIISVKIVETEAYCGSKDKACHASKGRTTRTEVMFGRAGHAYVYLIYGMYHCLNIVTEQEGYPAAVLIRSIELARGPASPYPVGAHDLRAVGVPSRATPRSISGPGKLCRELKIDRTLNTEDIVVSKKLWVEDRGEKVSPRSIKRSPRIGVDYAGSYKDKLWRFYIEK